MKEIGVAFLPKEGQLGRVVLMVEQWSPKCASPPQGEEIQDLTQKRWRAAVFW